MAICSFEKILLMLQYFHKIKENMYPCKLQKFQWKKSILFVWTDRSIKNMLILHKFLTNVGGFTHILIHAFLTYILNFRSGFQNIFLKYVLKFLGMTIWLSRKKGWPIIWLLSSINRIICRELWNNVYIYDSQLSV